MGTFESWHVSGELLRWGVALGAALTAAVWDAATHRIPNPLTGIVVASGLAAAAVRGGWAGTADTLCGAMILGLPFVVLFVLGGGGGGDAKLMAGLGAWLGMGNAVPALVAVMLSGAVLGLVYAGARGKLAAVIGHLRAIGGSLILWGATRGEEIPAETGPVAVAFPYGVSIFVGTSLAAVWRYLWVA